MADPWTPTDAQTANLGMGANPFLGQANPYLQQNIDASSADLVRNYNLTQQPAFNAAMANSGSFGNAGLAQMNADAQNTLQKNLGNLSNTARMQDYSQQQGMYQWQQNLLNQQNQWQKQFDTTNQQWNLGFDKNVFDTTYNQNMNNLQVGMGLLGTMGQYNTGDVNAATQQQNTPMNYWQQFANQANAFGQGYGTSTGTIGSTSNPMMGALGGAQLGSSLQNYGKQQGWWGNNAPSYGTDYSNTGANMAANTGTWSTGAFYGG